MVSFILQNILPFVCVLGFLVFVHELGHFLMAKAMGVKVIRFSMGFPPRAFGIQVGGTDYCISWLPLGGYVKMAGDEQDQVTGQAGEFLTATWWRRALIAVAGPGSNIIWAYVIIWIALVIGIPEPDTDAIVYLRTASPIADSLGVADGDRILSVAGKPVESWGGFVDQLGNDPAVKTPQWPRAFVFEGVGGKRSVSLDETTAGRLAVAIQPAHAPVIGNVLVNQPAYLAGLRMGDSLVAIGGAPVRTFEDAAVIIHAHAGKKLSVLFLREGTSSPQLVEMTPVSELAVGGTENIGIVGIEPRSFTRIRLLRSTPWEATSDAGRYLASVTVTIVQGLGRTLFHLKDAGSSLTGPIGIAQMAATYARRGIDMLLQFTAFIGVTLAVMNVLPLPLLDGGHIAMALYEGLMRRPPSMKVQIAFQRVGLALIGTLFVFVILADTVHLVQRQIAVHHTNKGGAHPTSVSPP